MGKSELFTVSRTYDIVTPESAQQGDFSESGYVYEPKKMTIRDVLSEINSLGYFENLQDHNGSQSLYAADAYTDYHDGSETREALHIDASERVMRRLTQLLKVMSQTD